MNRPTLAVVSCLVAGLVALGVAVASPAAASPKAGALIATVAVGANPQDVAVSADGKTAYVTTLAGMGVDVIDLSTHARVRSIPLGYPAGAIGVLSSGDLLVAEASRNAVADVDPDSGKLVRLITVGVDPIALAVIPHSQKFVTSNATAGTVTVADAATGVSSQIPVGAAPWGVAVAPDGRHAYVAVQSSNQIVTIDLSTRAVGKSIPVGTRPAYVAISRAGTTLYVADASQGDVAVVALNSGTTTKRFTIGGKPWGIAVSPSGHYVYVADNAMARLVTIDTRTGTTGAVTPAGENPDFAATTPTGATVLVVNSTSNTLSMIRGADSVRLAPAATTASGGPSGPWPALLITIIVAVVAILVAALLIRRSRARRATTRIPSDVADGTPRCPNCATPLTGAKFCWVCGAPAPPIDSKAPAG